MQKLLTFLSAKNISVYAIFNDQSFNDTLINDIISFEQLGLDVLVLPRNIVLPVFITVQILRIPTVKTLMYTIVVNKTERCQHELSLLKLHCKTRLPACPDFVITKTYLYNVNPLKSYVYCIPS